MIPEEISGSEYLYRAIHNTHWLPEQNRPTTSAFRNGDEEALSVDRQVERSHEEAHMAFHERPVHHGKRLVGLEAGKFRDLQFVPRYAEVKDKPGEADNPFHCDLLNKEQKFRITKGEALIICDAIKDWGIVREPLT